MSTDMPEMPLSRRARQWWDAMPRTQRVNRLLYGLALVSMLGLLVELGLGSPQTGVDLASISADKNGNPATTRPESPTSSVLSESPPSVPGGLSLADILAQITFPSIPEADAGGTGGGGGAGGGGAIRGGDGGGGAPAPARATATTAGSRSQPSGGGGGGGSPAPAEPAPPSGATSPPAQSNPPADDPPASSPTTPPSQPTETTRTPRTTVAWTTPTFPTDIGIPMPNRSCGRRCP